MIGVSGCAQPYFKRCSRFFLRLYASQQCYKITFFEMNDYVITRKKLKDIYLAEVNNTYFKLFQNAEWYPSGLPSEYFDL